MTWVQAYVLPFLSSMKLELFFNIHALLGASRQARYMQLSTNCNFKRFTCKTSSDVRNILELLKTIYSGQRFRKRFTLEAPSLPWNMTTYTNIRRKYLIMPLCLWQPWPEALFSGCLSVLLSRKRYLREFLKNWHTNFQFHSRINWLEQT